MFCMARGFPQPTLCVPEVYLQQMEEPIQCPYTAGWERSSEHFDAVHGFQFPEYKVGGG